MDPNYVYAIIYSVAILVSFYILDWMVIAFFAACVFTYGAPIYPILYWADQASENNKNAVYAAQQEAKRISRLNPLKVKSCEFEIFFATGCILDKKSTYEIHQLNKASKELLK